MHNSTIFANKSSSITTVYCMYIKQCFSIHRRRIFCSGTANNTHLRYNNLHKCVCTCAKLNDRNATMKFSDHIYTHKSLDTSTHTCSLQYHQGLLFGSNSFEFTQPPAYYTESSRNNGNIL